MSLLREDIKRASTPRIVKEGNKWNFRAEEDDWRREKEKEKLNLPRLEISSIHYIEVLIINKRRSFWLSKLGRLCYSSIIKGS